MLLNNSDHALCGSLNSAINPDCATKFSDYTLMGSLNASQAHAEMSHQQITSQSFDGALASSTIRDFTNG